MSQDQMRVPPFLFQLLGEMRHPASIAQDLMPDLGTQRHALQAIRFLVSQHTALQSNRTLVRSDRHQLMAPLLEVGSQLSKLAWKILMNQQQPHVQIR